MNKLILFPFLIMLLLSVISTAYGFEGVDTSTETGTTLDGFFDVLSNGRVVWHNNVTGSSYYITTREGDPRMNPDEFPDEPFAVFNTDTGKKELYDDRADFIDNHSSASHPENILDTDVFWGILFVALGVGIALGVTVVGTGISEWAQRLAFYSAIWGVVWVFLTLASKDLLINVHLGTIGYLIYVLLTMFFIIGIILDVQAGEA